MDISTGKSQILPFVGPNEGKKAYREEKTFEFTPDQNPMGGRLIIEGENWDNERHCDIGGLLLHCQSEDTLSPWHNFQSDTSNWHTKDGSPLCSNNEGMAREDIDFIKSLLALGSKKIWSDKKKVTLIGTPSAFQ